MRDRASIVRPRSVGRSCAAAALVFQLSACAASKDAVSIHQDQVSQDPAAMMRIGEAAEASDDWFGADTFYRRAAELDPTLATARLAHARMTARQGDFDAALATLRDAHKALADDPAIATALGRMLAAAKRPAEALTVFEDGLKVDPTSAALLVGKGVALDLLGRHPDARQAYEAALRVDPDDAAARKNLDPSRAMERPQPLRG